MTEQEIIQKLLPIETKRKVSLESIRQEYETKKRVIREKYETENYAVAKSWIDKNARMKIGDYFQFPNAPGLVKVVGITCKVHDFDKQQLYVVYHCIDLELGVDKVFYWEEDVLFYSRHIIVGQYEHFDVESAGTSDTFNTFLDAKAKYWELVSAERDAAIFGVKPDGTRVEFNIEINL